jgi:hypothetical protein
VTRSSPKAGVERPPTSALTSTLPAGVLGTSHRPSVALQCSCVSSPSPCALAKRTPWRLRPARTSPPVRARAVTQGHIGEPARRGDLTRSAAEADIASAWLGHAKPNRSTLGGIGDALPVARPLEFGEVEDVVEVNVVEAKRGRYLGRGAPCLLPRPPRRRTVRLGGAAAQTNDSETPAAPLPPWPTACHR